jgi:hypothetical protein
MHSPPECLREPVAIPVFRINRRGIPPEDGSRLPERFEIHYTSKYVYPLNTSKIELIVLGVHCLNRRISDLERMQCQICAWESTSNNLCSKTNWQFSNSQAWIKVKRIYSTLQA